jgi:hypothetical protein
MAGYHTYGFASDTAAFVLCLIKHNHTTHHTLTDTPHTTPSLYGYS